MKIGVNHLLILPILLPLITGALLLFYDERRSKLKSLISISSTGLLVIVAVLLIIHALKVAPAADVYRLGNWPSPLELCWSLIV